MVDAIKIDILMPVYNEEKYIEQAVMSVLNHVYGKNISINLIVVDDMSTDQTFDIVKNIESPNPSCKLTLIKGRDKGKNNSFNLAYQASSGDFLCFMGGDDVIIPEVLVERARSLKEAQRRLGKDNWCAVSCCKIMMFSSEDRFNNIVIPKDPRLGSVSGGAITLTRAYADRIFPLPVGLPNEDTWIGLYLKYLPCEQIHVPRVGLNYRIHENNSHKRGRNFFEYKEMIWNRSRALLIFYSMHYQGMDKSDEKKLLSDIAVSIAKYLGWWFIAFFVRNMRVSERVKFITHSTRVGFSLRHHFFRFFAGR